MKKKLLFILLAISITGFSQQYGIATTTGDGNGNITGFEIEFWDETVTDEGFNANEFDEVPVVDSYYGENGTLQIMTIEHDVSDTEWWKYSGNLQYALWDLNGSGTPFNMKKGGALAQFTIETRAQTGFWIKLTNEDDSEVIEPSEPFIIDSTGQDPLTVTVDFAKLASAGGDDINSLTWTKFYLWFWSTEGTSDSIYLHGVKLGSFADTQASLAKTIGYSSFLDIAQGDNVEKIEKINVLGQIEQVATRFEEIEIEGVSILKVTLSDGRQVIGKIGE